MRALEERLPAAEATEDYFGLLSAVHYLGRLTLAQGDFDAALHYLGRSLELADRLGARSRIAAVTSNLAEVRFHLGDWTRARDHAGRLLQLGGLLQCGRAGQAGPTYVLAHMRSKRQEYLESLCV